MGKVVMYSSVSVDGSIADENDQPGPLFDWLSSGDVPITIKQVDKEHWTYDYIKVCSEERGEILMWCYTDAGGAPSAWFENATVLLVVDRHELDQGSQHSTKRE